MPSFSPKVDCSGWSLAFEVPLKIIPHDQLSEATSWNDQFKSSDLYVAYGEDVNCVFHHLVLGIEGGAICDRIGSVV